jgi:(1->4)-alpha-D-glucan 1-alpha-D-glucosylmutase
MAQVPRATYRVQLHADFGFDAAAALADYLAELGVSHLYASPYLQAAPGSQHGYDIVDHGKVNGELGGARAHARMCEALAQHGLSQVLDMVPNHMAVGVAENVWWWDVLEHGAQSRFARYFDVDWDADGDDRVLLPILGERYFDALEAGLIRLTLDGEQVRVRYRDHVLPAAPRSIAVLGGGRPIDDALIGRINGSLEALDAFLEHQSWKLAYWKTAATDLRYRRFFDVTALAGLRMEDPEVFERTHALILAFLRDGIADGLRIDHPDGLRDPEQYLARLRETAPGAWIVVEKILAEHEPVPASWPIDGTTGYEVLRLLDQVQVDAEAEAPLTDLAARFAGGPQDWAEMARDAKLQILDEVLAAECERVAELAHRVLVRRMPLRDCTRHEIRGAVRELLASYDVYRTYVRPGTAPSPRDRATIRAALERAAARQPEVGPRVWSALEDVLLLRDGDALCAELALRVQQLTGPVGAKGIEDTLFYRHVRLLALNEVGGAPERFGVPVEALHAAFAALPHARSMLATGTHDTKRGEDMRARLIALTQMPAEWAAAVERWSERSRSHRGEVVDGATEYFFYQTLAGAHPLDAERAWAYMQKAIREAKRHTSWTRPDAAYESGVEAFVRGVCGDRALMSDVARFVAELAPVGFAISLSRTLLKLTAPGVPDFYQGSELWDLSLVDPDNRRPVDYARRRALLRRLGHLPIEAALDELEQGTPKLLLTWRVLNLRRKEPELFEGPYRALEVAGPNPSGTIAFARGDRLLTVVPRLTRREEPARRRDRVQGTAGRWRNVLTGERVLGTASGIAVGELWSRFPVALLVREA